MAIILSSQRHCICCFTVSATLRGIEEKKEVQNLISYFVNYLDETANVELASFGLIILQKSMN